MCVTQKLKDYNQAEELHIYSCCETFILIFPLLTNCLRANLVLAIIVVDKKPRQENMHV